MKFFLDSTDIKEIIKYSEYGIVDGITTNPTLMSQSKLPFCETVKRICDFVTGDISIEIVANDYNTMLEEGKKILAINKNIVLKLPITWDGIKACKYFSENGTKVNMTLCFSENQALIAAKVGAYYISPFIGRLNDIAEDGMLLVSNIRKIYNIHSISTKILAASIRTAQQVFEVAMHGADVATLPVSVLSNILDHELTNAGLEIFNRDWKKSGMKI